MGLLKNLFEIAGKVVSVAQELAEKQEAEVKKTTPSYNPEAYEAPTVDRTPAEWQAYFREIIQAECPGFEVREKVPVTELVGNAADEAKLYKSRPSKVYKAEWGEPYSFVLFQGGAPKGVVMLGDGHSHSAKVKYLVSRMYTQKLGIPHINFYTQMPNESSYVASRLHRFLD